MSRRESLSGDQMHSGKDAGDKGSSGKDDNSDEFLARRYGERGIKAIQACRDGKVEKYLDFFVVHGVTGTYVVEDDFCTCSDFLFRSSECWRGKDAYYGLRSRGEGPVGGAIVRHSPHRHPTDRLI